MKSVNKLPVGMWDRRDVDRLDFLPAALEILEKPPSPIGRLLVITIALAFTFALIWACLSHIDITATARGKIIPVGDIKVVQPFETGVIRAIHVTDGQTVHAGDVLIELDPRFNAAEGEHLRNDLVAAELDIARVNAALADVVNPIAAFQPPDDASPSLVDSERKFLISQLAEHAAKMAALKDQQREKKAEVDGTLASIAKLQSVEAVEQQILDMRQQLADRGYVSKLLLLQTLQAVTETKSDLVITKDKLNEANAALAAMTDTIFQAEGEYRRGLFAELDEAKRKAGGLQHDLEKIAERAKLERLTAPVSGIVQQLAVHTEGGVVTPAERLMLIVPDNAKLEVEAMLTNRDVGFVHPGQAAQVKVDTFDFTRYGLLHGIVSRVSPDAVIGDPNDLKGEASGGQGSNAPQPQSLNYAVRIAVDRTHMEVGDSTVDLRPGMAVTVDIKTGRRSVISYLLSPLLRRSHQSLHER